MTEHDAIPESFYSRIEDGDTTTYTFLHPDGPLSFTESEVVTGFMRWWESRKIAREQIDPDGEYHVDLRPLTVGEGLLVQEMERLHAALGVEWPK